MAWSLRSALLTIETAVYPQGPFTALDTTSSAVAVDVRKGLVRINASLDALFVRISYTAGYKEGDESPEEIKQALLCYLPMMLLSSSSAAVEPKQAQATAAKSSSLDDMAETMIVRYSRRVGGAHTPYLTETVPLV